MYTFERALSSGNSAEPPIIFFFTFAAALRRSHGMCERPS